METIARKAENKFKRQFQKLYLNALILIAVCSPRRPVLFALIA